MATVSYSFPALQLLYTRLRLGVMLLEMGPRKNHMRHFSVLACNLMSSVVWGVLLCVVVWGV
jgi:hypothetical protein